MPLDPKELKNKLSEDAILNVKDFEKFEKEAQKKKVDMESLLLKKNIVNEEYLSKELSRQIKIPFIDLTKQVIRKDLLFQIPEQIAQKNEIVIFGEVKGTLEIAMSNPGDLQTLEFIKKKIGRNVKVYVATKSGIRSVLKQYKRGLRQEFKNIIDQSLVVSRNPEKDLKKLAENMPIVRIVSTLVEHAVLQGASDIHIEPLEKNIVVRYRIDGILRDVIVLPKEIMAGIVARIKVLSNLKIDEHRLPQDGRFKIEKDDQKISFRVSILPVFDGEKIVMRLLIESGRILSLEELGLRGGGLKTIMENVQKPNGMILVTGPTGSGKTSTLYSVLNILNTTKVNIATIEDPIEYRMPRINQSQVKAKIGFTFANGLRSLVRQDPDIIMVGEIRDEETAEMAIHSALTGHLVLSTLHTMNSAGAFARLSDMQVKPFLISSTVNVVVAQRLARKICTNCIEEYKLDKVAIGMLESQYDMAEIIKVLVREKVIEKEKSLAEISFYKGKGCDHCDMQGYKGRVGIFEVLDVNEAIKDLVVASSSSEKIQAQAVKDGMLTMIQDGFAKAITKITSIEEILRITKE